jgi:hypothetical protein
MKGNTAILAKHCIPQSINSSLLHIIYKVGTQIAITSFNGELIYWWTNAVMCKLSKKCFGIAFILWQNPFSGNLIFNLLFVNCSLWIQYVLTMQTPLAVTQLPLAINNTLTGCTVPFPRRP